MNEIDTGRLACIEVGGGGIQTVLFSNSHYSLLPGPHHPVGSLLAMAVPGLIGDGVVVDASNLGWRNTDPVEALGVRGPAVLLLNDGEAAALGEVALRASDGVEALVYIGLGTGIAGAVVAGGAIMRSNLFAHNILGHGTSFGSTPCRCGRTGCLEAIAGGWALPDPIDDITLGEIAKAIARAIEAEETAADGTVVIGGGIPRRYDTLVPLIASHLPTCTVEPSLAPANAKSAAAWGLRFGLFGRRP